MADIVAMLLNVDSMVVRAVFDALYSLLLIFALRRKKSVSGDKVVQDDLQRLIDYHKKTVTELEKLQTTNKKEGE